MVDHRESISVPDGDASWATGTVHMVAEPIQFVGGSFTSAEEVMPVIARECGGKVELPARGLNLVA